MDNVALHTIKEFIQNDKVDLQLVPLHQHQANVAESTIETFKDYFIAAWLNHLAPVKSQLTQFIPNPKKYGKAAHLPWWYIPSYY